MHHLCRGDNDDHATPVPIFNIYMGETSLGKAQKFSNLQLWEANVTGKSLVVNTMKEVLPFICDHDFDLPTG
jgi:hypothetical protein